jgi:lysine-N-methylase
MKNLHPTKSIKVLAPRYVSEFRCIGDKCSDTCCSGWRVTVDKKTYFGYQTLPVSELAKQLKSVIKRNRKNETVSTYASFEMDTATKDCPMLKDKLCQIQTELGSEYLSNTCSIYPRKTQKLGESVEQAMTLSCPEAARLALESESSLDLMDDKIEIRVDTIQDFKLKGKLDHGLANQIRAASILIVKNKKLSYRQSLTILGFMVHEIQILANENKTLNIENFIFDLIDQINNGGFNDIDIQEPKYEYQVLSSLEILRLKASLFNTSTLKKIIQSVELIDKSFTERSNETLEKIYRNGCQIIDNDEAISELAIRNYMINEMLLNMFPFSNNIFHSYCEMVIKLGLIKAAFSFNVNLHPEMDKKTIFTNTVQAFTREFDHDNTFKDKVQELIKNTKWNTMESFAIFI